jgi:hypothetical protein
MNNQDVFTKIYKQRIWGNGTPDSPSSGDGSLPEMSLPYLQFVQNSIQNNEIESVFDFGHGDWTMWRDYKFENVSYLGIDIAEGLSERVGAIYENPTRKFLHSSELTKGFPAADLFISKEVFQHLSNPDVTAILEQLTSFKYLILCNGCYSGSLFFNRLKFRLQIRNRLRRILHWGNPFYPVKPPKNNSEIVSGDFRGIDLEQSPFSEFLVHHKLLRKFDFPGRNGSIANFRVYFYVRDFS